MRARTAAFEIIAILIAGMTLGHSNPCEAAIKKWVKIAPCALGKDPSISSPLFSLCLEGSAGEWVEQRSKVEDDTQPALVTATRGNVTAVITSWLSLRAGGYAYLYQNRTTGKTDGRDARSDNLLVQMGNSSTHRHRLFGGKSRIPFGLNYDANAAWTSPSQFDEYFGEVMRIAGYTYDNQKDLTFTITGGVNDKIEADAKRRKGATGARVMYDLAALEGTRLLGSFATDELEHRRGEIGGMNVNGKGDVTAFEVVRIWRDYPYDPSDFGQLIRVTWIGSTDLKYMPRIQYEDQSNVRRIGTLGVKINAKRNISVSSSIGYCKDESGDGRNYWLGVAGAEVHL